MAFKRTLIFTLFMMQPLASAAEAISSEQRQWVNSTLSGSAPSVSGGKVVAPGGSSVSVTPNQFKGEQGTSEQNRVGSKVKDAYGDDEALTLLTQEATSSGNTLFDPNTGQGRAYEIMGGIQGAAGVDGPEGTFECRITRNPNDMLYDASKSRGTRVKDAITVNSACEEIFYTNRGSYCEAVPGTAKCLNPNNNQKIRSVPVIAEEKVVRLPGTNYNGNAPDHIPSSWFSYHGNGGYYKGTQNIQRAIKLSNMNNTRSRHGLIINVEEHFENCTNLSISYTHAGQKIAVANLRNSQYYKTSPGEIVIRPNGSPYSNIASFEAGSYVRVHATSPDITENSPTYAQSRAGISDITLTGYCEVSSSDSQVAVERLPTCDNYVGTGNCRIEKEVVVTPDIASVELNALYDGDSRNPVCWDAEIKYECVPPEIPPQAEVFDIFPADMSNELIGITKDCKLITSDEEQVITESEIKTFDCAKSATPFFEGCRINNNIQWRSERECSAYDEDRGLCRAYRTVWYIESNEWTGSDRCFRILENIKSFGDQCSYTVDTGPDCPRNVGCGASNAPGGWGDAGSPYVEISGITCDPYQGSVQYEGKTYQLEPFDSCSQYKNDSACQRIESVCSMDGTNELGSFCSEIRERYRCEVETTKVVSVEQSKMVCGNQTFYCQDGSCLDQRENVYNEGFAEAAAMLSAVQGIASHTECDDPTDASTCRVFQGENQVCRKGRGAFSSLWNCCDIAGGDDALDEDSYVEAILENGAKEMFIGTNVVMFFESAASILQFLIPCNSEEMELAISKEIDATVYIGTYCGKKISLGFTDICIRDDKSYCAWPTALGRVIMEQARPQLGYSWGSAKRPNCGGLTINQIGQLDWSKLDLSDWANKLIETGNLPKDGYNNIGTDPAAWTPIANPGGVR